MNPPRDRSTLHSFHTETHMGWFSCHIFMQYTKKHFPRSYCGRSIHSNQYFVSRSQRLFQENARTWLLESQVNAFSVYQTYTSFQVSILINLWTMSIRMNGPHAKTALTYTFILRPVKARNNFSSKIVFTKRLILYF